MFLRSSRKKEEVALRSDRMTVAYSAKAKSFEKSHSHEIG